MLATVGCACVTRRDAGVLAAYDAKPIRHLVLATGPLSCLRSRTSWILWGF